ncbi:hypothetical protein DSO57_1007447 [Entomophthora muscae]|uniref:Uncharacterized protein n=1 Tax=Entomophthora muscae TaxID=34485 RepID=A0ACC2U5L2_9FUNG|nr:hypothetical protein DSO57_1007447 [Entomophthora muscae]
MSPPHLEGTPKEKWELWLGRPTQSVHPLCGPSPPGFGGVLPARGPLFLMVLEIHPDPGLKIAGGTKYLKARYAVGDPVYTLNPNSAKLEPNHLGPFKIAEVYENHTYQLEDAQGNTKKLHHDCLRPCCAIPTQKLFVRTFPDLLQTPVLVSDNKQGTRGCCNQVFRLAC